MTQLKNKAGLVNGNDFNKEVQKFLDTPHGLEVKEAIEKLPNIKAAEIANYATVKTIMRFLKETYLGPLNKLDAGLLNYPILMAADILLYNTNLVPVGEDQLQHIEITRTLAKRFNNRFGETFAIPKAYIQKEGMRIMGLDDPTKKMSKSAKSEYNYIALTDNEEAVYRKIKKAVTDSGTEIKYTEDKPALKNLINIYSSLSEKTPQEVEKNFTGKSYADFKKDLTEITIKFLKPFQKKMNAMSDEQVLDILQKGAEKVRPLAKKKLEEVKKKIGFVSN